MSIQSMTGFAKEELEKNNIRVSVEIKSVNGRFKDFRFRMSSQLNHLEPKLKNIVSSYFKRGSFDIHISYKLMDEKLKSVPIDAEKVSKFINSFKSFSNDNVDKLVLNPTDFIRNEFLEEIDKSAYLDDLGEIVLETFEKAAQELKSERSKEGVKIVEKLQVYRELYAENFYKIKPFTDKYREIVEQKLLDRLEQFSQQVEVDNNRLSQEIIFYLEKLDINEELDRIKFHLDSFDRTLKTNGEVGRQIDFLLQELNRETNTIGSKSGSNQISECVVQMKSNLEKIREQNLNLE